MTHSATQWSFHEGSLLHPRPSPHGQPTWTVTRAHLDPKWKSSFAIFICHDHSRCPSRQGQQESSQMHPRVLRKPRAAPATAQTMKALFKPCRGLFLSIRRRHVPLKHGTQLASGGVHRERDRTSSHPRRWQRTPQPAAKTARCSI